MTAPDPDALPPTTSATSSSPPRGAPPSAQPAGVEPRAAADAAAPVASLASLPGPRRLALSMFLLCLLFFYALAQSKLVTAVGGGSMPGPQAALFQYHGDPSRSRLQSALDPALSPSDSKRMYDRDGAAPEAAAARRAAIIAWIKDGAPRTGWQGVERAFTSTSECAMCHSKRRNDDDTPRSKSDLPFDTYEEVKPLTRPGEGMSLSELATSSHNHMFGFSVAALLVSLVFTATRWRGRLVTLLVASAFVGAAVDVASWWLTREHGSPYQWGVIVGGGAFGLSVVLMAALALDELVLSSRVARAVSPLLARLGLARLER